MSDRSSPSDVGRRIGRASLEPAGVFSAGAIAPLRIVFRVGRSGFDDGGRLRVAFRINGDWGVPQTTDPAGANYTTVATSGPARVRASFDPKGGVRPWSKALTVIVDDGCLSEGDTITIGLGDPSGGGPGFELQPYCEREGEFQVLADVAATGAYVQVPVDGRIEIVAGPPASLVLLAPSDVVVGEPFRIGLVLRDAWGNPAPWSGRIQLRAAVPLDGLPDSLEMGQAACGAVVVEGVVARAAGVFTVAAEIPALELLGPGNPIVAQAEPPALRRWWGDLHGQSAETCGTGPADDYLAFARDRALLDFAGHQGNDFELTDANWGTLRRVIGEFHDPGRFVTFLGYEWSGNTGAGGDFNVVFRGDDAPVLHSGRWLLESDQAGAGEAPTIEDLSAQLCGRDDVLLVAHVGGRYADVARADPALTPLVEVWSTHGEFEWILEDALARGLRVGVTCGSDDHTGRLGLSVPGRRAFAVRGGLLCVLARELTREALWAAIWARRCYGTTGERIALSVTAGGHPMGSEITADTPPAFEVEVHGTAAIERVELRQGMTPVAVLEGARGRDEQRDWVRLGWRGARNRGREREACWDGRITVEGTRILEARTWSFDRRREGIVERMPTAVRFSSTTAGDSDGIELRLADAQAGRLHFETAIVTFEQPLAELGDVPVRHPAEGLGLVAWLERLPAPLGRTVQARLCAPDLPSGPTPYHVHVIQRDGAKAWSSPIWVTGP